MESRKLAIPLLAFAGGAILGRLLGLKTLVRGAMLSPDQMLALKVEQACENALGFLL